MNRMRSVALPALWALGGLGLWGSSATAQYVGGGTPNASGYYYAPGPGHYGPGYYYAPQPTAGPYYYVAPAPYYATPAPSFRSSVRGPRRVERQELSRPLRPPRAVAQLRPGTAVVAGPDRGGHRSGPRVQAGPDPARKPVAGTDVEEEFEELVRGTAVATSRLAKSAVLPGRTLPGLSGSLLHVTYLVWTKCIVEPSCFAYAAMQM